MAEVDVNIDIQVENNTSWELNEITNNVVHIHQAAQQAEKKTDRLTAALRRIGSVVRTIGKVAASLAAIASAAGPATSAILAAGKAIAAFGKASLRLTPLLAFLPSLVGAFALVKTTVALMAPGFAKAFQPILSNFRDAKGEASAFTKRLQDIVGIGVKPLAQEFTRLNIPAIQYGMERIGYAINAWVVHTLAYLNTAKGMAAIKVITEGTAKGMESLFPHIMNVVRAMTDLVARVGDRALVGFFGLLGKILDRLAAWADNTSVEDINRALKDLAGYGTKLRDTFGAIRDIGRWLGENEGAIKHFSDVAAAAAITLGAATGNIPAVVLGVVSLILNHWAQLKAPFAEAAGWVKNLAVAWQKDAGRIAIADSMLRAFQAFKDKFNETIKDIGPKWKEFVAQLKGAWEEWAPLIKAWWDTGGKQAFQAAGVALGLFITHMIEAATAISAAVRLIAAAFKWMVMIVLDTLGGIINGAAKAFGWVPGIGPKLRQAASEFNAFRDSVNRALEGITPMKTIRINSSVYVTSGGPAGQSDQRTGNSRQAGFGGLTSWQAVAAAFAGGPEGTSRTGGPQVVTASVQNTILLDGRPFRDYTVRALAASESRSAWRSKTGHR